MSPVDPREEERKAAEEAGAIGGPAPEYDGDEAERPVAEGGEGESEGHEVAERDLEAQASHSEDRYSPRRDAFSGEVESDRVAATGGDADDVLDRESVEGRPE